MRSRPVFLLFLSFLLCAFFITSDAFARTDRCPRHQVKTELKSKRFKTSFQHGSIGQINDYLNNHDRSSGTVLAFVEYGGPESLSVDTMYKFAMKPIGDDRYCVMLEGVRAYFYAAPTIVMPRNYRKGSCEYKLILKHEKRHLQALYDFHESNTKKYQSYLGRIARDVPIGPPIKTEAQAQEIQAHIANYFSDGFYTQVNKSLVQLGRKQQKIDSPQEYIGVGRKIDRCEKDRKNKKNKKLFYNK